MQNTTFTVSELLSENQQRDSNYTPPPPQILGYIKNIAWIKHYYQAAALGKCLVGVWPWILSFSLMCLWHTYPQILESYIRIWAEITEYKSQSFYFFQFVLQLKTAKHLYTFSVTLKLETNPP